MVYAGYDMQLVVLQRIKRKMKMLQESVERDE
jgi:hypothetical protein